MNAFERGKIKLDALDKVTDDVEDMQKMIKNDTESRMFAKIKKLDYLTTRLKYSVCAMAERQDDKFTMVLGRESPDSV